MAGSDVKSSHLHGSGFFVKGRTRVRAMDVVGTASAGHMILFDTDVAPVSATYGRSGTTVTVTKVAHGLTTGNVVGIAFEHAGAVATSGNYVITVTGTDTFTVTDINTGTISAGSACLYAASNTNDVTSGWLATFHASAGDTFYNGFTVPDEGLLARKGVYATVTNLANVNIYYN